MTKMEPNNSGVEHIIIPIGELDKPYKIFEYPLEEQDGTTRTLKFEREGYTFPITDRYNKIPKGTDFLKKPVKIPLSTTQLIEKLQDETHKITFTDAEIEQAKADLTVINYYRISAFRKDIRQSKTTYTQLMNLYQFDRFLRTSISRLVPTIEIALKTSLARFISINFENSKLEYPGGLAYLDMGIYKQEADKQKDVKRMLSHFSEEMTRLIGKDNMIKHHIINYGGQIPIWVLFEEITLGEFSKFVSLLPSELVQKWCEDFFPEGFMHRTTHKDMKQWISTIQVLRNTAAHGSKVYAQFLTYNPRIQVEDLDLIDFKDFNGNITRENIKHTVFAGLVSLKLFYSYLRFSDKKEWNTFLVKLSKKLDANSMVDITKVGMPKNWFEILYLKTE